MIKVERLNDLSPARREGILARSTVSLEETMEATREILRRLREDPERELLREYGPLKAGLKLEDFRATDGEIEEAFRVCDPGLIAALKDASRNILKFHELQLERQGSLCETMPGLVCGRVSRPLASAGVYVPGGRAAYPSSALMNVIPARAAGVKVIACSSPPGEGFRIRPEILAAASLAGATSIWKLGGAWAVGSLAYGLCGVPKVDKIVGPGSSWVNAAKMAVFGDVDVDLPAGPSEGFIVADSGADAGHLAWDFLAQLEHDPQAAAVLVTPSEELARKTASRVSELLPGLSRSAIVREALANAAILVADDLDECLDFANLYAPEHLQIVAAEPLSLLGRVVNAGSVFLGPWSPIPCGDYASGPNHVLPTGGAARAFSGLSADSFMKKITFQQLSRGALEALSPAVTTIARAEGLECHAETVLARLGKPGRGAPESTGQAHQLPTGRKGD
ncbi:MAG: histidinol dehydrogenase [Deltaproteobacteria bacterium]|jgi:histidinol dehydrogenase|nr:histidinol dehydrogenase [Deltaproteobacteria bacterium]